jgi:hypothetical protein
MVNMRVVLNVAAAVLLSVMLAEPLLASNGVSMVGNSDVSLIALGLAGVMLGRRSGYRVDGE